MGGAKTKAENNKAQWVQDKIRPVVRVVKWLAANQFTAVRFRHRLLKLFIMNNDILVTAAFVIAVVAAIYGVFWVHHVLLDD